ncbi:MAG: VCBS repeat-containing protein, partial [Xanthomonadales bacterium]|nr:VCBS repeat-containing protein [Xanthomonadales bacterium]
MTVSAGASAQFRFEFGYVSTRDMMPAGVAAGDIDNDGDIDLIVPQGDFLPVKVLRNQGDGSFVNVASEVGLSVVAEIPAGALLADLDGNGFIDLVLTGIRGFGTRLYLNDGGIFSEATMAWGLSASTFDAYSAAAGDIDGDGKLELAVSHWDNDTSTPPRTGHLWHNQTDQFADMTISAGLGVLQTNDLTFTPIFADMDGDHQLDL